MNSPEIMEEDHVKGTCQAMCPRKEALLRQKENLLHKFEMKIGTECNRRPEFDPEKVVKSFSRSAAGTETSKPENLRPFPVLLNTIKYLYTEVFPQHIDKPLMVYNFMFDRFRAIRQDAVIQNLPSDEFIQILEPIVRFLIYFSYILADENISDFDAHINNTHLQECLKRLLVCYDECADTWCNRWDNESAYLLFNLGNIKPLTRGIRLCSSAENENYSYCLNLSFQWYLKNYVRVFQMMQNLSPLLLCVASISMSEMRNYVFRTMSHAYSSANSAYPVSQFKRLLLYENELEVLDDCQNFNIKVKNGLINFTKKDFDVTGKCKVGVRLKWIDNILSKCDLVELLCFGMN